MEKLRADLQSRQEQLLHHNTRVLTAEADIQTHRNALNVAQATVEKLQTELQIAKREENEILQ